MRDQGDSCPAVSNKTSGPNDRVNEDKPPEMDGHGR
jgi:hypothetical protein